MKYVLNENIEWEYFFFFYIYDIGKYDIFLDFSKRFYIIIFMHFKNVF